MKNERKCGCLPLSKNLPVQDPRQGAAKSKVGGHETSRCFVMHPTRQSRFPVKDPWTITRQSRLVIHETFNETSQNLPIPKPELEGSSARRRKTTPGEVTLWWDCAGADDDPVNGCILMWPC